MRGVQELVRAGGPDREDKAADWNFFQVITPRITSCGQQEVMLERKSHLFVWTVRAILNDHLSHVILHLK